MVRRWVLAVVLVAACSGCVFLPGVGGPLEMRHEAVGPRHELGPVPRFTDEGREAGHMVVFFETRDGWCLESPQGGSCTGGDAGLPVQGFDGGLSGSEGPDGTCIETVAGNDVAELRVATSDGRWTTLPPLAGGEEAPVRVFAACWDRRIPFDDLSVEARDADGEVVGTHQAR